MSLSTKGVLAWAFLHDPFGVQIRSVDLDSLSSCTHSDEEEQADAELQTTLVG